MPSKTLIAILAVALCSCVSKGKYETLKKKHEETVASKDKKISTLEQAIKKLEGDLEGVRGEKGQVESKLAEVEKQREQLQGELTNVVKDRAKLKASAEDLKKALAELSKREVQAQARLAQFRLLLDKFKKLIDAGKLKVKIADGRMILVLPSDVLFASGKAKLSDDGEASVIEVAKVLATFRDRKFQVEGHTDNVPIKSRRFPSNWDLAAKRSLRVVKTMVEAGVPGGTLSAASYGEFRPANANDSDAGRANNRRIEIVLVPDLSALPGFQELNKAISGS